MNCANHPDLPVSVYCQNCGKPLCTQCLRSVAGVVYCEPCLAARLNPAFSPSYPPGSPYTAGTAAAGAPAWTGVQQDTAAFAAQNARIGRSPSPVLAGFLGLIPGVGAMYNGQFVKAFAHVIIFVILISIAGHVDAAGLLVAAWVFYQVFDAAQTAIARRDGRPLPDPLGLNDLGQRLGMPAPAAYMPPAPTPVPPPFSPETPAATAWGNQPPEAAVNAPYTASAAAAGTAPGWAYAQPAAAAGAPFVSGSPGEFTPAAAPMPPLVPLDGGRPEPIGAIVLIGVGMLFLLSTLGVFHMNWIGRGWPVLIILIGAGLLISRVRSIRRAGGAL